jgi:hypothetical protein
MSAHARPSAFPTTSASASASSASSTHPSTASAPAPAPAPPHPSGSGARPATAAPAHAHSANRQRQYAHLHAQLAQLNAHLADMENLLRMTAVQAEHVRGLGGWMGGLCVVFSFSAFSSAVVRLVLAVGVVGWRFCLTLSPGWVCGRGMLTCLPC